MQSVHPRDPFGVALGAIRRFADQGRFEAGSPLVVTDLAAEVGLSATPMREALACLAGEGLIERRRGRGYFFPDLTAADLIDLFELQRSYVHAALHIHAPGSSLLQRAGARVRPEDGIGGVCASVLDASGNRALAHAHDLVVRKLSPALQAEQRRGEPTAAVLADLLGLAADGDVSRLSALFDEVHIRRCAIAASLADDLQVHRSKRERSE